MKTDNELISKFSNIYIMLLYSIMTNDISRVKHYLSDNLYHKYKYIIAVSYTHLTLPTNIVV